MSSTQTITRTKTTNEPLFLHLIIGSNRSPGVLSQSPTGRPSSAHASYFTLQPPKRESSVFNTFIDDAPSSPAWYVQSPKSNPFDLWIRRKYYQYEVTWGLYVLTPGEKIIINTLVLTILSLVALGIFNTGFIQQAARVITNFLAIVFKEGVTMVIRH